MESAAGVHGSTETDGREAEEAEVSVKDIVGEAIAIVVGIIMVAILFVYLKVLGGEIDV